jgi:hypothetical protein
MNGRDSVQSLLVLRKLTRAIADAVRVQMTEYLVTLTPLLRPASVLGEHIQGAAKDTVRKSDKVFKELQGLYETIAPAMPFSLPRDLSTPVNFPATTLEITTEEYTHVANPGANSRTIAVRCPLSWILTYTGYAPSRVRELLGGPTKLRATDELQKFVLSQLILHVVLNNQPGLTQMLAALHFPVTTAKLPDLGDLPITRIRAAVSTMRPSDAVVIESAELSGVDAFEEIVEVEEIARLSDPLKQRLLEITRQLAPELAAP